MLFSIIVPVYNRPDEMADLLASLDAQTDRGFEIVIVEDGSTIPCLEADPGSDGSWIPRQNMTSQSDISAKIMRDAA